jgi:hypothetical protein
MQATNFEFVIDLKPAHALGLHRAADVAAHEAALVQVFGRRQ